jgi:hypothetical protein
MMQRRREMPLRGTPDFHASQRAAREKTRIDEYGKETAECAF